MRISLRHAPGWLALIAACSGATFKAGDQNAGGEGGVAGATMVGGAAGTMGGSGGKIDGGAPGRAGAPEEPVSGGQPDAIDPGGAGGESGAAGGHDPACALVCRDDEHCAATPAGPECRCSGAFVRDGAECRAPRSCDELHRYDPSLPSGAYSLKPDGAASSFQGYCGMTQEGGGWTLILNEGPSFDPTTSGAANALCYSSSCTSIAYSLVPLDSGVMIDVSNSPIGGTTYSARLVVTGVHALSRGKTLRTLFTTGPNYVEAENNSNLAVRMRDGADCDTLPADLAKLACQSCDTAGCKEPVIVFGDFDAEAGCRSGPVPHFAIGAAYDYTTPWTNCAGWPQDPDYVNFDFYPDYVRVWIR